MKTNSRQPKRLTEVKTSRTAKRKGDSRAAHGSPASSWEEVPALIDGRPAEYETVAYGITRSLSGKELWVDFGNELGELSMAKLTFRDEKAASDAYCKGIRLGLKVVEHPEHKLENDPKLSDSPGEGASRAKETHE